MGPRPVTSLVIVDTDILIDAGRGVQVAISYLRKLRRKADLAVSVITQMELMLGCRQKIELQRLDIFLSSFQRLKINELISDKAVWLLKQYRLSHGLSLADALIAATALTWNCLFASKNQRDYRFITGLFLLPYPPPATT